MTRKIASLPVHARSRALGLIFFFILILFLMPAVNAAEPNLSTAIIKVAQQTIPAVVHINVTQKATVSSPLAPFLGGDPFFPFFDMPRTPKKFKRELRGVGSGMLIDANGNILTNGHVVEGATKIQVILADGREFTAKTVGIDPKTDLAIIKIQDKDSFPFVRFGNSDKVEVGEWVIAIGHPRGLDQTVTQGIISAKNRRGITDPSSYQDFLQTDAAINPGNSGGPLLNLSGEVIGVNAIIASASGGFEGIGFAVPSNMALYVTKALMKHGKVERGWLGVSVQDLTFELAKSHGLKKAGGALVGEVTERSPAEQAGIKQGDIILTYNGKDVPDGGFLRNEVAASPVGGTAKVGLWRDNRQMDVTVKIGNQQTAAKMLAASLRDRLGVDLRPITPKEAEKYGLESNQGLVVNSVKSKGIMAQAGIEKGDIILEVNGQAIRNMDGFASAVSSVPAGKPLILTVVDHRTGKIGLVQVKVS